LEDLQMSAISDYIRNLAVFLIFASFINIINPGKKFEQYINLVLGIILIFVLIAPLSGIINALAGSSGDIFADISLAYDRAALAQQIEHADQQQQRIIIDLYTQGLTEQATRLVNNHGEFYLENSFFNIDTGENFGKILLMQLILRPRDSTQRFVRIDPVRIAPVIGSRGEPIVQDDVGGENPHIISLKNLLAGFYNLTEDNIIIEIRN